MEKKLGIKGMMCMHCAAAVKAALEEIDTVSEAVVSHETGTAIVKLTADTADKVLKKAVKNKGYKVVSIS